MPIDLNLRKKKSAGRKIVELWLTYWIIRRTIAYRPVHPTKWNFLQHLENYPGIQKLRPPPPQRATPPQNQSMPRTPHEWPQPQTATCTPYPYEKYSSLTQGEDPLAQNRSQKQWNSKLITSINSPKLLFL